MIRRVEYKGRIIEYDLQRKRVKNINLRIKPNLTVVVSANNRVSAAYIDSFVLRKADFILDALKHYSENKAEVNTPMYTAEEFAQYVADEYNRVAQIYSRDYNLKTPRLKMRTMKSRWGSCNYVNYIITLNTNLIYCTKEQITYVIIHEFSHLIVHNHSKDFYNIVIKYCPDYKRIRKEMNRIVL